ncbi:MAG: hypothetical protein PHI06_14325, partial [Desulfobulbaceae bacterium]|nr:hypothetical protein [Desulfobulbaceae bacterium]
MKIKMDVPFVILLLAELLLVPSIAEYLANSHAISVDTPGHLAESLIYRDQILPNIYVWNSYFFFGYPIASYPPFSHIVIGLFSYLVGLEWAIKTILAISCLLLPATAYYFLVKHTKNQSMAAYASLALSVYMVFSSGVFLTSLTGALYAGLVANYVAMPLFFLALAAYPDKRKLAIMLSVLVIVTNMAVAAGLFICIICIELLNWFENRRFELKRLTGYLLWTFALSSFWFIPFLINQSEVHNISPAQQFDLKADDFYFNSMIPTYAVMAIASLAMFHLCRKTENKNRETVGFVILAIGTLMFIGILLTSTLVSAYVIGDSVSLGLLMLLYPFCALYLIIQKKEWLVLMQLLIALSFSLAALIMAILFVSFPEGTPFMSIGVHSYRIQQFENLFEVLVIGAALG